MMYGRLHPWWTLKYAVFYSLNARISFLILVTQKVICSCHWCLPFKYFPADVQLTFRQDVHIFFGGFSADRNLAANSDIWMRDRYVQMRGMLVRQMSARGQQCELFDVVRFQRPVTLCLARSVQSQQSRGPRLRRAWLGSAEDWWALVVVRVCGSACQDITASESVGQISPVWLPLIFMVVSPSNSIWPHLSYDLVRSKREYCQNYSVAVVLCSCL